MARFHGEVGYGDSVEKPEGSGLWVSLITEITYEGDVVRNTRELQSDDKVNNDISVSNSISIVADAYAIKHFLKIKYVRWAGVLWTVPSVEVRSPRLILSIGSVYNGPTPILVSPDEPIFDEETGSLTIVDQEGVIYSNSDTDTVIDADGSPYLFDPGETVNVLAIPDLGYTFAESEVSEWSYTVEET